MTTMDATKRAAPALLWYAVEFGLLAYGVAGGSEGAMRLLKFLLWLWAIVAVSALSDDALRDLAKQPGPALPPVAHVAFSVAMCVALVWIDGSTLTAVAVLLRMLILAVRHDMAKGLQP